MAENSFSFMPLGCSEGSDNLLHTGGLLQNISGWNMTWNSIASIPLVETAPTTITSNTASCSDGSNYTIDGAFHVNGAGFTTVANVLHLEGTVSSAPVPAAAWLSGSGLASLAGVARRRRKLA